MTAREVLQAARDLISDRSHWRTGQLEDERGRVCAIGALNRVVGVSNEEESYNNPAIRPAVEALARVLPDVDDENDHDCVIAAFDAAIEKAS